MARYSLEYKSKVVEMYERGLFAQVEVANHFGVSLSFAEKLLLLHRRTGRFEPIRKRPGPPFLIGAAIKERVKKWLNETPDLTMAELSNRLHKQCSLSIKQNYLKRVSERLNILPKQSGSFKSARITARTISKS